MGLSSLCHVGRCLPVSARSAGINSFISRSHLTIKNHPDQRVYVIPGSGGLRHDYITKVRWHRPILDLLFFDLLERSRSFPIPGIAPVNITLSAADHRFPEFVFNRFPPCPSRRRVTLI